MTTVKRARIPLCRGAHGRPCPHSHKASKISDTEDLGYLPSEQCIRCYKACGFVNPNGSICFAERSYKRQSSRRDGELHPFCPAHRVAPTRGSVNEPPRPKLDMRCPGIPALEAVGDLPATDGYCCPERRRWKTWDDDPEKRELYPRCKGCDARYEIYLAEKAKRDAILAEIARKKKAEDDEKERWTPHSCTVGWCGRPLTLTKLNPEEQAAMDLKEREEAKARKIKAYEDKIERETVRLAAEDKHLCPRCLKENHTFTEVENDAGCWCKGCYSFVPKCKKCRQHPVAHYFNEDGELVVEHTTRCDECNHEKVQPRADDAGSEGYVDREPRPSSDAGVHEREEEEDDDFHTVNAAGFKIIAPME